MRGTVGASPESPAPRSLLRVSNVISDLCARSERVARAAQDLARQRRSTERERSAASRLREEFAALPLLPPPSSAAESEWRQNQLDLRDHVAKDDPRSFLRWPVIQRTMFVLPSTPYVHEETLPALIASRWLPLLAEDRCGRPALIPGYSTSGNLVGHAYHLLRFERSTGRNLGTMRRVLEVGGGYGSMTRLLYRLTLGNSELTIIDLPEFTALQRYFLAIVGVPAILESAPPVDPPEALDLFVATWSLSEIPAEDRAPLIQLGSRSHAFLIGYQDRFNGVDNVRFFREWMKTLKDVRWSHETIAHLPGNSYLFGVRE